MKTRNGDAHPVGEGDLDRGRLLLQRALRFPADDVARPLLLAAGLSAAIGADYVLLGGAAVAVYTRTLPQGDIDLAGPCGEDVPATLELLGFHRVGGRWRTRSASATTYSSISTPCAFRNSPPIHPPCSR